MIPFSEDMVRKAMEMVAEAQAKETKRLNLKKKSSAVSTLEDTKTTTDSAETEKTTVSDKIGATASSFSVVSPKTATLANEILEDESKQSARVNEAGNNGDTEAEDSASTIQVVEISSNGSETKTENLVKSPVKSDEQVTTVEQYVQSILQSAIHTGKEIPVIPLSIPPAKPDTIPTPPENPGEATILPSATSAFSELLSGGSGAIPKRKSKHNKLVADAYNQAIANLAPNTLKKKQEIETKWLAETSKEKSPKKGENLIGSTDSSDNRKTETEPLSTTEKFEIPTRKSNRLPNAKKVIEMGAIMYNWPCLTLF